MPGGLLDAWGSRGIRAFCPRSGSTGDTASQGHEGEGQVQKPRGASRHSALDTPHPLQATLGLSASQLWRRLPSNPPSLPLPAIRLKAKVGEDQCLPCKAHLKYQLAVP